MKFFSRWYAILLLQTRRCIFWRPFKPPWKNTKELYDFFPRRILHLHNIGSQCVCGMGWMWESKTEQLDVRTFHHEVLHWYGYWSRWYDMMVSLLDGWWWHRLQGNGYRVNVHHVNLLNYDIDKWNTWQEINFSRVITSWTEHKRSSMMRRFTHEEQLKESRIGHFHDREEHVLWEIMKIRLVKPGSSPSYSRPWVAISNF